MVAKFSCFMVYKLQDGILSWAYQDFDYHFERPLYKYLLELLNPFQSLVWSISYSHFYKVSPHLHPIPTFKDYVTLKCLFAIQ